MTKKFHLLVNHDAKRVILIDANSTSTFDLRNILGKHDSFPQSMVGIRRILAEVDPKLDTTSDEHIKKFLYNDLYALSIEIYTAQTYTVIVDAHKCDARGDVGGEYFGHPLDDGLPSPDLRDYTVAFVYGSPPHRGTSLGSWISGKAKGARCETTVNQFHLNDAVRAFDSGKDLVDSTTALKLALCGASVQCTTWDLEDVIFEYITGQNGTTVLVTKHKGEDKERIRKFDSFLLNQIVADWRILTLN